MKKIRDELTKKEFKKFYESPIGLLGIDPDKLTPKESRKLLKKLSEMFNRNLPPSKSCPNQTT